MSFTSLLDRAYDIEHDTETKVVRHVRTPAGVRRFNQPIGSIIVRDRKLRNLTGLDAIYDGWDRAKGKNGKEYSVGYDEDNDEWIATEGDDDWDAVVTAKSEDEIWDALDSYVGGGKGKRSASGAKEPKGKGKGTGNREDDYGPMRAGDTVIVDGSKATGRNAKAHDGKQGSVETVGSKFAKVRLDDGSWIQVPKNALVKNNSGLKKPGDRSTYSGVKTDPDRKSNSKFKPKALSSADAKFMQSRNGVIGGGATNPEALKRFVDGKGSEKDNILIVDHMLRRYRAVTAPAVAQQPRNKSAADKLKRIFDNLGIKDPDAIVKNRNPTYTAEARRVVTGSTSESLDNYSVRQLDEGLRGLRDQVSRMRRNKQNIPDHIINMIREYEDELRSRQGRKSFLIDRATKMSANARKRKPCMPGTDNKFPIGNVGDLRNAIRLAGHSNEPTEKVHAWIKKRARELNAENLIPEDW